MSTTNPLAQLTAAEASVVQALNAVAGRLDAVGTNNLEEAVAHVLASAAAAKDRLAQAVASLAAIAGDVVETFAGAAADIEAALAIYAPPALKAVPAQIAGASPAPTTTAVVTTAVETSPLVALAVAEQLAGEPALAPLARFLELTGATTREALALRTAELDGPALPKAATAYRPAGDEPQEAATQARQELQEPETPQELFTLAIASQKQRQATEPADAPTVTTAACSHRVRDVIFRYELADAPTVTTAACSPVEPPDGSPSRDDRAATRRKRR